ncbi:hypothetical protein ACRS6B_17375 [Nocardia asteroides]
MAKMESAQAFSATRTISVPVRLPAAIARARARSVQARERTTAARVDGASVRGGSPPRAR